MRYGVQQTDWQAVIWMEGEKNWHIEVGALPKKETKMKNILEG